MQEERDDTLPVTAETVCTFEGCTETIIARCLQCSLNYCLTHASEVDPQRYCINCLLPADAEFTETPLVDKDGVTHKGRVIHPGGKAYRLSAKMVFEMTDEELRDYVISERKTVHELENIREYHRITLGAAEAEEYRRELSSLSKVGGVLRWGTSTQRVPAIRERKAKTAKASSSGNKVDDIVGMLKQLGMTPEALAALILQAKQKK